MKTKEPEKVEHNVNAEVKKKVQKGQIIQGL